MHRKNGRGGRRSSQHASSSTSHHDPRTRKLHQLCRQVHERVDLVLAGELDDPRLEGLWVADVIPEAGGTAMLVTLVVPDESELAELSELLTRLSGRFRSEVAAAINRKRTPNLRFALLPARALQLDGGAHE